MQDINTRKEVKNTNVIEIPSTPNEREIPKDESHDCPRIVISDGKLYIRELLKNIKNNTV